MIPKWERETLLPLGWIPRNDFNGAADFDAGQNYTRPARHPNGPMPYPPMIGCVQGLLGLMTATVSGGVQHKPASAFYLGGNEIAVQGGMSFGNQGINGMRKVKG